MSGISRGMNVPEQTLLKRNPAGFYKAEPGLSEDISRPPHTGYTNYTISEDLSGDAEKRKKLAILRERVPETTKSADQRRQEREALLAKRERNFKEEGLTNRPNNKRNASPFKKSISSSVYRGRNDRFRRKSGYDELITNKEENSITNIHGNNNIPPYDSDYDLEAFFSSSGQWANPKQRSTHIRLSGTQLSDDDSDSTGDPDGR